MGAARVPLAAAIVSVADHAGDLMSPRSHERLYAAADLLDELYEALELVNETSLDRDLQEIVDGALAKARGEA
jgi:hypothetical protein